MPKAPVLRACHAANAEKPSLLQTERNTRSQQFPVLFLLVILVLLNYRSEAQMVFTAGNLTQTENFNGMSGLVLPSGFVITTASNTASTSLDQNTTVLTQSAIGKTYRFVSNSTDYAVGILNSPSFQPPRSITLTLENNTGADITGFTVNFQYEKYRSGISTLFFYLYGSSDSVTFTNFTAGNQGYAADANNNTSTFSSPITAAKTVSITGVTIPQGGHYYLRWTLAGSVTVNNSGQAIGIDDVSITAQQAAGPCTAPSGLAANNITGTGADLSWSAVTGATGYEYTVDQNAAAPSGSGTATTATSFSASGLSASTTYYLHVRTNCGSGNYSSWTTISFNTTACTPPAATITPAGPTTFCTGNSVVLNANTGTGLTYQWKLNGANISNATSNSYTATASGDYKVIVSNGSCSDSSAATTVTVNALPTAVITPSGPTTFCNGGSVMLTGSSNNGLYYQWRLNGTDIGGASTNTYTATAAGNYKVVVTNAALCTDSSAATTITINTLPVATITPAGPTTFCAGGSVILNANTGTGLSYQWKLNGANISNATNSTYTATSAGNYKVIVSNGSCTDSSTSTTVTVNTVPAAMITPAGPTTFCNGGSTVLNANTGTGLTYQWRLNGANISGATASSYTASASGDYKVIVTNASSCSDSSAAVTITANVMAGINITPAGPTTFCNGGNVILNATTGTGLTYQWSVNSTNINGATNSSYTATAAGDYKVIVTNGTSCSDSSAAVTVSVNVLPAAIVTPAGPTTFCAGGNVVLNANTGNGFSYQWRLNGTNINGATNASYTANVSGNYKVIVTNTSLCADSSIATAVTINTPPAATITPAGSTNFCTGGNVILNANTGTGFTYQWRLNGTSINGATNATYTATAAGNYKVIVTNASLCTDSSSAVAVTINTLPAATVTPTGPTTFCTGGNIVLNANTGTGLTYQWKRNGSNISGATNAAYTANTTGDYKVVVANASLCADSSTAVTVTVNALPSATVTPAGPVSFCTGGNIVLNANTGAGLTYQWKLNGNNINAATNATYTANTAGAYKVIITNTSLCTDSSTAVNVTVNALPTATVTPAGPTTFCAGGNVILNANTGTGFTYQWKLNSSNISGATNAAYTANTAGDYKVVINNASLCADSSTAVTITVNTLPAATITPAGPTNFCTGGNVVLNANTGVGLTYQWKLNGSNLNGATNAVYTAGTAGTYKVVVSNGTCTDSSAATTVTINALPVASVTPAGPTTFCTGGSVVLNANTGTGFTYQWKLNGTNITGATNATYTANASGDYKVIVTNASLCTDSTAAITVTVNALPTAIITPSGPTTFCAGGSVILGANTGTGLSYQWKLNGSNISGATNASYTANTAGNYRVFVTNGSLCADSSTAVTVTVNALPAATATPAGPTTFCAGVNVVLNANTGTGLTYQWKLNGSNISGATNAAYTATAAGNYKVIVTNTTLCSDSSAAVAVSVNALPVANITAGGATAFCAGSDVVLSANSGAGLAYQWRVNGNNISGATNINYTANTSGIYKVVVTNGNGCTDSSAGQIVTVNPMPAASITAMGNTTFCSYDSVLLDAGSATGVTYQWQFNGGNIFGATSNTFYAATPGIYTVNVSNGNCSAVSPSLSITTYQVLTPVITQHGDTLSTPAGYTGYQWYLGTQPVAGATSNVFIPAHSGQYTVIVTDTSGCTANSAINDFVHTAIPNVEISKAIKMYPNPATAIVHIEAPVPVKLTITTADGRTVMTQENSTDINIAMLAQGVYFVRIMDKNGNLLTTRRLLKTAE